LRRFCSVGLGVVAVLATAVVPSVAHTGPPDPLAEFQSQPLTWAPCKRELECATVVAPLDYAKPEADRISLVISRKKAGEQKRGILISNPGGPGGSGLGMPDFLGGTALAKAYDLIGFDPRGVGGSTALKCQTVPAIATTDSRPADSEFVKWTAEARAAEDACERAAGGIRKFVNTANTARDMDIIRAALGEQKINYLGYSYGTYLGAVYGTLFPNRLDRSVLDSSVHPEWIWREQFKAQAVAYRRNVELWAAWAGDRDGTLKLGKNAAEVLANVEKVAAQLATTPIGSHTRTEFDAAMGVGARFRPLWAELADIVGKLGTGTAPEAAAEQSQRLAASAHAELESGVFSTVTCEADWPRDVQTYYEEMRAYRDRYPYGFGVLRAAPTTCTFRSFTPPEPLVQLKRDGYPVGVVVQGEGDTQTQYESGPAMATRLGDNLITVLDEGKHGLYGSGNDCVDAAVNRYLVDGILPPSSSTCKGDPRPDVTVPPTGAVQSFLDKRGPLTR
jgi:pimeloyl-ACP methyl ester carboxylesterase